MLTIFAIILPGQTLYKGCLPPIHIALVVIAQEIAKRFQSEAVMDALGVEPDQIVEQFIVEPVNVGEQKFFMVGSEFLLQVELKRSICAFILDVSGVRPILGNFCVGGGLELAAIVQKHPPRLMEYTLAYNKASSRCKITKAPWIQ